MKLAHIFIPIIVFLSGCQMSNRQRPREVIDFNFDWQFRLENNQIDADWAKIRLPHDYSILAGYQKDGTAASTGFVSAGIGWYQKEFNISSSDEGKRIWIEFDGVYCNSTVWINGVELGFRPSGYISFDYELTDHLNYGGNNIIKVKVDHSAYADQRWYTGSGIYRNVRLVKTNKTFVDKWGLKVKTTFLDSLSATIEVDPTILGVTNSTKAQIEIISFDGQLITTSNVEFADNTARASSIKIDNPMTWSPDSPNLYVAKISVWNEGKLCDQYETTFGIRSILFDANEGFFINNQSMKIKGVNLHHDAGALGSAVPKSVWEYRVKKLKSIGVNAIRMSHNPHSIELLQVCDEQGILVMDEFFDEWHRAKNKNMAFIGDNNGKNSPETKGYSSYFLEWAERDLKDQIKRDFNHPSVIMWSIGNEIEWTFPYYSKVHKLVNDGMGEEGTPEFDPGVVRPVFDSILNDKPDSLTIIANKLVKWVKDMDNSRPITCGSVRPSVGMVSGYGTVVDILGFNYRASSYDEAHLTYPNLKIIGSENWGAYSEWKAVSERDFVSGMFAWTGFAYLGEAGPWPRKGLEISFFDYAGIKTPRGHFFECLWNEAPKVYIVTTPASTSEFSYSPSTGWSFDMQMTPPPAWGDLRKWEWYKVNEHWNYTDGEMIVVQAYTNCDDLELFLNGISLGKKSRKDFVEDNIIKWQVPFKAGELIARGYINNDQVEEYKIVTTGKISTIKLHTEQSTLRTNKYDISNIYAELLDNQGNPVRNQDISIQFEVSGAGELVAVDNGWEMNIQNHYTNTVTTHNGRALAFVRSSDQEGKIHVSATSNNTVSNEIIIVSK